MPSLRQQRVRELLKRTVGEILRRELDSESCGIITVNDVGMANDLHSAMVFVSVLGSDEQKRTAAKCLKWDPHVKPKAPHERAAVKDAPDLA